MADSKNNTCNQNKSSSRWLNGSLGLTGLTGTGLTSTGLISIGLTISSDWSGQFHLVHQFSNIYLAWFKYIILELSTVITSKMTLLLCIWNFKIGTNQIIEKGFIGTITIKWLMSIV
ncbi:hypothetical protein ACTFIR_011102 [Dictyostelium discoideum]